MTKNSMWCSGEAESTSNLFHHNFGKKHFWINKNSERHNSSYPLRFGGRLNLQCVFHIDTNSVFWEFGREPCILASVSRSPRGHASVAPDKRHLRQWMSSLFCGFLPHPFIHDLFRKDRFISIVFDVSPECCLFDLVLPKCVPSDSEKHRRVYTSSNVCHSHEWRVDTASGKTFKKRNACVYTKPGRIVRISEYPLVAVANRNRGYSF